MRIYYAVIVVKRFDTLRESSKVKTVYDCIEHALPRAKKIRIRSGTMVRIDIVQAASLKGAKKGKFRMITSVYKRS